MLGRCPLLREKKRGDRCDATRQTSQSRPSHIAKFLTCFCFNISGAEHAGAWHYARGPRWAAGMRLLHADHAAGVLDGPYVRRSVIIIDCVQSACVRRCMRACVHEKMCEKMRRCVRAKTSACCVVELKSRTFLPPIPILGPLARCLRSPGMYTAHMKRAPETVRSSRPQ